MSLKNFSDDVYNLLNGYSGSKNVDVIQTVVLEQEIRLLLNNAPTTEGKLYVFPFTRESDRGTRRGLRNLRTISVAIASLLPDTNYNTVQTWIDYSEEIIEQVKTLNSMVSATYDPLFSPADLIERNLYFSELQFGFLDEK